MITLTRTLAVLALVAAAGAAAIGIVGSPAVAAGDCTAASDWGTPRADLAAETVALVNAYRASLGLRTLTIDGALQASAVWKARHMARYEYMTHSDPAPPVARSAGERMAACGYTAGWGENIAAGYPSPQSVVSAWLASPGHRANIENPSFVAIGTGAALSGSGWISWAHTFGTSGGSGPPPPPSPPPPPPPPPPSPPPPPAPSPPPPSPSPPPSSSSPSASPPPAAAAAPISVPAPAPQRAAASAAAITLSGLKVVTRPTPGGVLATIVKASRRGADLRAGHVFCSARLDGRRLEVLRHRLRRGNAVCSWAVPESSRGATISAVVIVERGRVRTLAPFRSVVG